MSFPGGLPPVGWNVQNMTGAKRWETAGVYENMRMGVYGAFRVSDGPFRVTFNTGEVAR